MDMTPPPFGPREIIGLIVAIAAIIGFLASVAKLTFTKGKDSVIACYNPGDGGFHLNTRNLSVVTLCVSAVLLAVITTAVFAQQTDRWVYLGPGFGNFEWNFLTATGSKDFVANDVVVAQRDVNIRADHFSTFTQTWLRSLSPPEPAIVGLVKKGECVKVLGFTSVGFNKIWMNIEQVECRETHG